MISSISSSASSWMTRRPDPSEMVSNLFSKLDTKNQGYLEESDLEAALSEIADDSSSVSVSDLFSQLDADGDGKVTESEMSSSLQQLADQLDAGFNNMRTSVMGGGMPPPPPPLNGEDEGFTEEELTAQLEEVGSTDSARSSLLSSIVANFDEADTNDDGKVSMQEAMAYEQSSATSTTTAVAGTSETASSDTTQAEVLRWIMQLMEAYRSEGNTTSDSTTTSLMSSLSVIA